MTETVNAILLRLHGFGISEISRQDATNVRQSMQVVLSRFTCLTYKEIGEFTGGRNHASINHSRNKVENAEYVFKKYGTVSPILNIYKDIETAFRIEVPTAKKHFRSYQDECKKW